MNETETKILAFLIDRDWTPTTKISRLLKIDYYLIEYALEKLEEESLIEKKKVGKRIRYWRKV